MNIAFIFLFYLYVWVEFCNSTENTPSFSQNEDSMSVHISARASNEPTNEEQLLLEHLNRMRMNPVAELELLTNYASATTFANPASDDPDVAFSLGYFNVDANLLKQQWSSLTVRQPLSWNPKLASAARKHAQLMDQYKSQNHQITEANEPSLRDRISNEGYMWGGLGENIFAFSKTPFYAHARWAIDWGEGNSGIQDVTDHRDNMMNSTYCEVGMSFLPATSYNSTWGPFIAVQDFGKPISGCPIFLLGVVYNDKNKNGFYSVGEGISGVTVSAETGYPSTIVSEGDTPITTTTYGSGGYSLVLPAAGIYTVTFSGVEITTKVVSIMVSDNSVKQDYDTSVTSSTTDFTTITIDCNHNNLLCDDGNPCTIDICDSTRCVFAPVEVPDDGNLCTVSYCDKNFGIINSTLECRPKDRCTCDPQEGCVCHESGFAALPPAAAAFSLIPSSFILLLLLLLFII